MTDDANTVLAEWYAVSNQLAELKEREEHLRDLVVKLHFSELVEGTEKRPLGNGYVLQAKATARYTVDKDEFGGYTHLQKLPLPSELLLNLFSWKPDMALREYKKLTAEEQAVVNRVVTKKIGRVAIEIVKTEK